MRSPLQIEYVDLNDFKAKSGASIQFTLYWLEDNRWEGQDYSITVR